MFNRPLAASTASPQDILSWIQLLKRWAWVLCVGRLGGACGAPLRFVPRWGVVGAHPGVGGRLCRRSLGPPAGAPSCGFVVAVRRRHFINLSNHWPQRCFHRISCYNRNEHCNPFQFGPL